MSMDIEMTLSYQLSNRILSNCLCHHICVHIKNKLTLFSHYVIYSTKCLSLQKSKIGKLLLSKVNISLAKTLFKKTLS